MAIFPVYLAQFSEKLFLISLFVLSTERLGYNKLRHTFEGSQALDKVQ